MEGCCSTRHARPKQLTGSMLIYERETTPVSLAAVALIGRRKQIRRSTATDGGGGVGGSVASSKEEKRRNPAGNRERRESGRFNFNQFT